MQYFGGKARIAKDIIQTILRYKTDQHTAYYEPFVGGASVLAASRTLQLSRYASDILPDLIIMYKALQQGWKPPKSVSRDQWLDLRAAEPSPDRTFAGFACSNRGKFFRGYAYNSSGRNYALYGYNSLMVKLSNIQDVVFSIGSYDDIDFIPKSLIYCDPPYGNAEGYENQITRRYSFDTGLFWAWAKEKAQQGHTVFVSEYEAPSGVETVWAKEVAVLSDTHTSKRKKLEKLFYVPKQIKHFIT